MLYNNSKVDEICVVAVMVGDDLSNPPFGFQSGFIVAEEMLQMPAVTSGWGLVPITDVNLRQLNKLGVLTDEMVYVIQKNRRNVGFYF